MCSSVASALCGSTSPLRSEQRSVLRSAAAPRAVKLCPSPLGAPLGPPADKAWLVVSFFLPAETTSLVPPFRCLPGALGQGCSERWVGREGTEKEILHGSLLPPLMYSRVQRRCDHSLKLSTALYRTTTVKHTLYTHYTAHRASSAPPYLLASSPRQRPSPSPPPPQSTL